MKKPATIYLLLSLLIFFLSASNVFAALTTNLKDPGMTQIDWRYHQEPSCNNNPNGIWTLIGVEVDGTPCSKEVTSINWTELEEGKKLPLLLLIIKIIQNIVHRLETIMESKPVLMATTN